MNSIKSFIEDIKRLSIGHKPRSEILDDLYGIYAIIRTRIRHPEIGKDGVSIAKVGKVVRIKKPVCDLSNKDKIPVKGIVNPTVAKHQKN